MSLVKAIKRLEYANFLIKKRATGNLETFSRKMDLSKSTVKELIAQMKEMGAPIQYDRIKRSYYYNDDGEFCTSRFMKYGQVLTKAETAKIGKPEELCFSEKAIFVLCKNI